MVQVLFISQIDCITSAYKLVPLLFFLNIFYVYLLILREREREREREHAHKSMNGEGTEGGRERIPSKLHTVRAEPNGGAQSHKTVRS